MNELVKLVEEFIKENKLEITPELRMIDLSSEVGELSKEVLKSTHYGKTSFVKTDNLQNEVGDVLFALLALTTSLDINVEESLINVLNKYKNRINESGSIGSKR